jgi:hypothetical protein
MASHERYRDPKRLLAHGAQYWSQNLEDGMIAEIFRRIGTTGKTFLEIGVGNGLETNTTALLASGWAGWWIDSGQVAPEFLNVKALSVTKAFIKAENINALLASLKIPAELDFFSLDIDLNTYHIWAALTAFRPRCILVEYNGGYPVDQVWIHPYLKTGSWNGSQNFGASLKAYEVLGRTMGYCLVGCDLFGVNAFFVRADLVEDKFAAPFTAENHYEPPRYYLSHRFAHPPAFTVSAK